MSRILKDFLENYTKAFALGQKPKHLVHLPIPLDHNHKPCFVFKVKLQFLTCPRVAKLI